MASVVVIGGAGYIGAHVVHELVARGDTPMVVDDLSTGRAERLGPIETHRIDVAEPGAAEAIAAVAKGADAAIHFAAKKRVDESVARPLWYYRQNVGGLVEVLEGLQRAGVGRVVFSSSAAVYGETSGAVATEDRPLRPVNPYGETKAAGEWLCAAAARATGGTAVMLRYFNVAGAARPELGDDLALNLIPRVFAALDAGERPAVFGDDYATPDGTCIRDYVDVADLARAHVDALRAPLAGGGHAAFNVGTGRGRSVREVIAAVGRAAGVDIEPRVVDRRPGDPAQLVANVDKIRDELGWSSEREFDDTVADAWAAWRHLRRD